MPFQEMTALEFYNTKNNLPPDTYQVIEHDGEINLVSINAYRQETWRSQAEFEEFHREQTFEHMVDCASFEDD